MRQVDFISAALDPSAPVPDGFVTPDGRPAVQRFNVYRNNIVVGLKSAMEDGFPAVSSLVGEEFFNAMVGKFVRTAPPRTPILPLYGVDFAKFIDQFEPARSLPYLGDVARLEYAIRESYHAADCAPVAAAELSDPLLFTRSIRFAPTVSWLTSPYPVTEIRAYTMGGRKPTGGAQDILITRPEFDPVATAFPVGTNAVLDALKDGLALADAVELAPSALDLTHFLRCLLDGGAFTAILEGTHV